ncbi:hypothetical protein LCGC14_2229350 [marine sediment metagenome]|uniref:Transposase zinc-ribbon domain-containing protein n=1 Tax=marine sediment metagenome TaxID=412755 RepID=A0A0F9G3X7_9ZZZZ
MIKLKDFIDLKKQGYCNNTVLKILKAAIKCPNCKRQGLTEYNDGSFSCNFCDYDVE